MPLAPSRACAAPRCQSLVTSAIPCPAHGGIGNKARRARYDATRGTSTDRGYGALWRKARAAHLQAYPLCTACARESRVEAAVVLDHVRPAEEAPELFWTPENWSSTCGHHHATKTANEVNRRAGRSTCRCEVRINVAGQRVCVDCGGVA